MVEHGLNDEVMQLFDAMAEQVRVIARFSTSRCNGTCGPSCRALTTLSRRARAAQGVLWAYKPKWRIFSTVAVAAANLKQWDVMYAYLSRMKKAPSTSHLPPPSRASCVGRRPALS
jgi:hypothetical protein